MVTVNLVDSRFNKVSQAGQPTVNMTMSDTLRDGEPESSHLRSRAVRDL